MFLSVIKQTCPRCKPNTYDRPARGLSEVLPLAGFFLNWPSFSSKIPFQFHLASKLTVAELEGFQSWAMRVQYWRTHYPIPRHLEYQLNVTAAKTTSAKAIKNDSNLLTLKEMSPRYHYFQIGWFHRQRDWFENYEPVESWPLNNRTPTRTEARQPLTLHSLSDSLVKALGDHEP